MTGEYLQQPMAQPSAGGSGLSGSGLTQAEAARQSNNALAASMGGFPQTPPAPPLDTTPLPGPPSGAPSMQGGPMRGVAYPGGSPEGQGAPPGGPSLALVPGQARPAGWQPSTRDTKVSGHESPFEGSMVASALDAQGQRGELAGAQAAADAAQSQATRKYDYLLQQHGLQIAGIDRARAHDQLRQLDQAQQNIDTLAKDAGNTKVNPNKYFDDMSAPQHLLTMLGSAVAGFGYGFSGRGINPVEMINQRIRDSVEAQKTEIAGKQYKVGEARAAYATLKDRFGDDEKASLAQEMAQRQWVIAHAQEMAANESAPHMQRLRAAQVASALAEDNAKTHEHLYDKTLSTIEKSGSEKYQQAQGGAGLGIQVDIGGRKQAVSLAQYEQLQKMGLVPAQSLEARKTEADIAHTQAETKKIATPEDNGLGQVRETAAGVKSTAYNPLRSFQGTEGHEQVEANEDYNAQFLAAWRKKHPGKLTEAQQKLLDSYMVQEGDIESTVEAKKKRGLRAIGGGAAATDAGEGSVEE